MTREVLVPGALEDDELGAGDLARERAAVLEREHRVVGAVQHARGRCDLAEPRTPVAARVDEVLVAHARLYVEGAVEDAPGELAARRLVVAGRERALAG